MTTRPKLPNPMPFEGIGLCFWTGPAAFKCPDKGEWFVSGAIPEAIRKHTGFEGVITTEQSLIGDLGLDSLEIVALALDLEERPEHPDKLSDDDIESWTTVGDVVKTLTKDA